MCQLEKHLRTLGTNKERFLLKDLKKQFPKDKETIDKYAFIGIIDKDIYTGMCMSKITH